MGNCLSVALEHIPPVYNTQLMAVGAALGGAAFLLSRKQTSAARYASYAIAGLGVAALIAGSFGADYSSGTMAMRGDFVRWCRMAWSSEIGDKFKVGCTVYTNTVSGVVKEVLKDCTIPQSGSYIVK